MSDIDTALLPDFLVAAREHLDEIESMLIKLGENPESEEIIGDLFKPIHTIKGSAQFVGLQRIESLSHKIEDLLDQLRQDKMRVTTAVMDVLMDGRDRLSELVGELEQHQQESLAIDDLADRIAVLMMGGNDVVAAAPGDDEESDQELFQIFIDNLQHRVVEIKAKSQQCKEGINPTGNLMDCNEAVENLISSANYMGYEDLALEFAGWKNEISAAFDQQLSGQAASLDFMDGRLEWIMGLYPQIAAAVMMASDESVSNELESDEDMTAEVMAAFSESTGIEDVMAGLPEVDEAVNADIIEQAEPAAEPGLEPAVPSTEQVEEEEDDEEVDIEYELVGDFITEAVEHLEEIESLLLNLSNDPSNVDILNDVFRPIHTIKGGAQFIGLNRIARLSHRMEDLLDLMRRGERESNSSIVDTLIDGRDRIIKLVKELETNQREESPVKDLVDRLTAMIDGSDSPVAETKVDSGLKESSVVEEVPVEEVQVEPVQAVEATVPASNITLEGNDFYEEEGDQELFGIFIDQLREKASLLSAKVSDLPIVSDPAGVLKQCHDDIVALKSSANYMGYDHLNQFYEGWLESIDQTQSQLAVNANPSFDFMSQHLNELANLFPQLGSVAQGVTDRQITPVVEAPAEPETLAASDDHETAEEEALFNRLSGALDNAMGPASGNDHVETLHDVFEEMLSGKTVDTRAAIDAVKQDILAGKGEEPEAKSEPKPEPATVERRKDGRREQTEERRQEERRTGERIYKKSIRVDADKIDALMNQVGELVVDRSFFFQMFNEMRELQDFLKESAGLDQREVKQMRAFTYRLGEAIAKFGRTTNELQEGVMKVRMLPISQLFNRYPRLLRDLTHNTDKKVKLEVFGEDTELDKMIVEELADPLIHIIRNAVDHGLETAHDRQKAGKNESGTLMLEASQEGNHIVIDVTDDGRGIDPEKVKAKALSSGLHTQEELDAMAEEDIINLIMKAGFSTAEKITGTSGRGVGMDVVKTNIEKLNGTLEVDSELGEGTRMRIKIPLTLAIIPALMIRVGESMFTIPLANVEETLHIDLADTTLIEGTEVIHLRGQTLPIFYLSRLFNVDSVAAEDNKAFVVVVNTGGQQVGFAVDELMGQEEVVIKPLVDYLQEKSGFSGATIIGDGRISLILDIYALVKITAQRQANRQQQLAARRRALNAGSTVESSVQH